MLSKLFLKIVLVLQKNMILMISLSGSCNSTTHNLMNIFLPMTPIKQKRIAQQDAKIVASLG